MFLITLIITIAIHFIICEFFTYRSPLIAFVVGYIFFVTIGKICNLNGFESARKLVTTRIYLLFILLAGAYTGAYITEKEDLVEQYIPALWEISSLPFLH